MRIPISRMRERTVASIMFMMPTPPTASVTAERSRSITVSASVIQAAVVRNWVKVLAV